MYIILPLNFLNFCVINMNQNDELIKSESILSHPILSQIQSKKPSFLSSVLHFSHQKSHKDKGVIESLSKINSQLQELRFEAKFTDLVLNKNPE